MIFAVYAVVLASIAIGFVSLRRPGCMLALIWAMFATEQLLQSKFQIFASMGILANAIPVLGCGIAIALKISRGGPFLWTERIQIRVIALMLLAGTSVVWSVAPDKTMEIFKDNIPYFVAFCIVGPLCINSYKDLEDGIWASTLLSIPLLIGLATAETNYRAIVLLDGTVGNPLAVASVAAYSAISAFTLSMTVKRLWLQIALIAIAVLAVFVILKTGSRGQLVGCVLAVVFAAYIVRNVALGLSLLVTAAIVIIVVVAALYAIDEIGGKVLGFESRWDRESVIHDLSGVRLIMAQGLWSRYVSAGPVVWLIGLGSSASYKLVGFYCHIVPVEVICELGLLGFALYCSIFYYAIKDGLDQLIKAEVGSSRKVVLSILLSIVVLEALLQLKQGALLGTHSVMLCCIIIGRVTAISKRQRVRSAIHVRQQRLPEFSGQHATR